MHAVIEKCVMLVRTERAQFFWCILLGGRARARGAAALCPHASTAHDFLLASFQLVCMYVCMLCLSNADMHLARFYYYVLVLVT